MVAVVDSQATVAYLTNIGGGFRQNKGGAGSRGYHIYRRGTRVITEWGRVQVSHDSKAPAFWWGQSTNYKVFQLGSVRRAQDFGRAKIRGLEAMDPPYRRLDTGVHISHTPWTHRGARRR